MRMGMRSIIIVIITIMVMEMVVNGRLPCMGASTRMKMKMKMEMNGSETVGVDPTTTTLEMVPLHNNSVQKRRGIIFSEQESTIKYLNIAVPNRVDFREFVGWFYDSKHTMVFNGFSIEVFEQAVKQLHYQLNYTFHPYSNIGSSLTYNDMLTDLSQGKYDAVVGDISIYSERLKIADFTQPYLESGIVVVTLVKEDSFSVTWAFLRPFTSNLWLATGLFVLFTGLVIWILEHKKNSHFRGPPRHQAATVLWFIGSTMFFAQSQNIKTVFGRVVVLVWLFAVLIIVSSYTANLTSIMTVQKFYPTIDGINSLKKTSDRIGHQTGSYVRDYLINELYIAEDRLVNLSTIKEYAMALRLGPKNPMGVAAIVAELPYVQVLLSKECGFAIAGEKLTKTGLGYAFQKGSDVGREISGAILDLSESGRLQEIYNSWLKMVQCNPGLQSDRLELKSLKGLFIITGATSGACLLIYFMILMFKFRTYYRNSASRDAEQKPLTTLAVLKSFALYLDESSTTQETTGEQELSRSNPRINPSNPTTTT